MLAEAKRLRGASQGAVWASLRLLRQHLATHFAYTEALMEDLGYPDLQVDKRRHDGLLDRMRTLQGRLEREGATTSNVASVADAVEVWIAEHAVNQERRLAEFIRTHAPERQDDGSPGTSALAPVRSV